MNNLSWLLYLGNVLGNLGPCVALIGVAFGVLAAVHWGFYFKFRDDYNYTVKHKYTQKDDYETYLKEMRPRRTFAVIFTIVVPIFWLTATLSPSTTTIYAIAASQLGQSALQTPLAGKAGQALEAWLDAQIAKNTKEASSSSSSSGG